MQWVPDAIRAVTDLLHEAGVMGTIAFIFTLLMSAMIWRHMGSLLKLGADFIHRRNAADDKIVTSLEAIEKTNGEISARVHKLPSDACRAKTRDEIIAMVKEAFSDLSEETIQMVVKQHTK